MPAATATMPPNFAPSAGQLSPLPHRMGQSLNEAFSALYDVPGVLLLQLLLAYP